MAPREAAAGRERSRGACGRRKLDRDLAFGLVFCFVEEEQCGRCRWYSIVATVRALGRFS